MLSYWSDSVELYSSTTEFQDRKASLERLPVRIVGVVDNVRSASLAAESRETITFAGVPALLLVIAIIASFVPARRPSRVDPNVALRDG